MTPDEIAALKAENARLKEEVGFWERSNKARLLGIADDQWDAARAVIAAAIRWRREPGVSSSNALTDAVDKIIPLLEKTDERT